MKGIGASGARCVGARCIERGAALAFVVLMMLALLTLAHGALLAALAERSAARAAVRELRRRGAAEYAVAAPAARAPGAWTDSVAVWQTVRDTLGSLGPAAVERRLRRLGPESWLLEGVARDSSGVEARSARLAWAAEPRERVEALTGTVTVGPGAAVLVEGSIESTAPATVRAPMRADDCDPWQERLGARYAAAPLAAVAVAQDSTAPLSLGLLDFDRLLDAAVVTVSSTGTPAPAEALGACLSEEPWMWGDPDGPFRPCGSELPMRGSTGDVQVAGGVGQGLLVVDGDLTLTGSRLYGMVIVRGTLRLDGAATLEGMALTRDGLEIGSGSALRASACWAVRVLSAHRDALGGFIPVSGSHIGPT